MIEKSIIISVLGIGYWVVAYSISKIAVASMESASRNPNIAEHARGIALITGGLIEAVSLINLVTIVLVLQR